MKKQQHLASGVSSEYKLIWMPVVAAVCPFGFFNLAPGSAGLSVTGTDWPGPTPNPDKFFKSHGGAKRWRPWAHQLRFWGLLVREGQATREIHSWQLESALMPSRGLKCRRAGPMHMARQPGLCKSSTLFLTMYVN